MNTSGFRLDKMTVRANGYPYKDPGEMDERSIEVRVFARGSHQFGPWSRDTRDRGRRLVGCRYLISALLPIYS